MIRNFHLPGRSAVYACDGMAATSHPLATTTAIDVLKAGGNAADAAVAAVAALGVLEPHMTGIGGDCFCLVVRPGAPVWGYNGSGRAAATITAEGLIARNIHEIGLDSIHAVTVPGAVEAWDAILKIHGRFDLARALAPAIRLAETGAPVAPRVAFDWALAVERLQADPGAARHFLKNGGAPDTGDIMRYPALAATLQAIAAQGPAAFYQGAIAADIATTLSARGSFLTVDDFAGHHGEQATPISALYRGFELVELPPNGQGLAALVLLNILERFDLERLDPIGPDRFHLAVEAGRLAYAVRDTHIGDPGHMRVSVQELIDKAFAGRLANRIDRYRRVPLPKAPAPGSDTVYLTVVDRDRMAVSLINSLYSGFGVGVATEESGIMLHSRGACFVVDPDHPNTIGPAKRSMHTIIPALGFQDGRCTHSFGIMGGSYQSMGHAHVVSNMVDYGMDVQAAIDFPRAFFEDDYTTLEHGVPPATVEGLKLRGHDIAVRALPLGGGQMIAIDWERGVLIGGSDPRKDGCAIGY